MYSPFVKRYRSQARRLARRRVFLTHIPGFTYVRIFNLCVWRDGFRIGIRREGN